jgi:hypothetical protein
MSEAGAMPGDSHFIDWSLLVKQVVRGSCRAAAAQSPASRSATVAGAPVSTIRSTRIFTYSGSAQRGYDSGAMDGATEIVATPDARPLDRRIAEENPEAAFLR